MSRINLSFFQSVSLTRFGTDSLYTFLPSTSIPQTKNIHSQIESICNEKNIFNWIFKDIRPNGYSREDAVGFLEWANLGWKNKTHFVFIAVDEDQNIAGAFDIKSDNLEGSEIGYWVSQNHSGIASNSVKKLIEISKGANYKKLFAQTKEGNERSIQVLLRNGFESNNEYLDISGDCNQAFILSL